MECVPITNVEFSESSKTSIQDLRRRSELVQALSYAIPTGTMATIFWGNGALESSYSIHATDFEAMTKAMMALPNIHRRVIWNIAQLQSLKTSGNERAFWLGIARGCKLD